MHRLARKKLLMQVKHYAWLDAKVGGGRDEA